MDYSCAGMPGMAVYRLSITTSTAPVITPHRKDTCDISLPRDDITQETPQVVIENNITADANTAIVSPTTPSWNSSSKLIFVVMVYSFRR